MAARKIMEQAMATGNEVSIVIDDNGGIRTPSGERVVVVGSDLIGALCDSMHDKLGEEVRDVLYSSGAEWGKREFLRFKEEVEGSEKILYHLRNMSLADFKNRFSEVIARNGWGEFDIEEQYDFVFVHLSNSAYAEMITQHNMLYNDLPAGFFAGFFSELIGVDFDAVEVNYSKSGFKTVYFLADESIVMAVREWIAEGRTYEQILKSLEKREYKKKKKRSAEVREMYDDSPGDEAD